MCGIVKNILRIAGQSCQTVGIFVATILGVTAVSPERAVAGVSEGIDSLAEQIVARSAAADRTTIAIASFPHVDDTCSELSNFLVDELVLSLFSLPANELSIIERSQLDRIFSELELSLSGAVDANTTKELGRVHGVDTLLVGTLSNFGEDLRVNARLIDTESAQVYSAAAVNIPRTSTFEELMQRPATGGCTMMPTRGAAGSTPSRTAAAPGNGGLTFSAGELESFDQLLGEWYGMMECDGQFEEIWFLAEEDLANGVTGTFRRSSFQGWSEGKSGGFNSGPGSASMTLLPDPDDDGVWFRMAAKHYQHSSRDFSEAFMLQLVGKGALYGTAASDQCNEVNLGRRQSDEREN
ncbi:FlgO family outer membrane protein [Roseovarius sp. D22-M7]|uniref:FlgO family outer membrane protein n=1 Tax=Roseovarius sp. D22-M7 TaxID=3127116 RepID=UPI00300FE09E